ncbi:MAG: Peptidoglycan D,D-transpeptidase MrdA [Syntrophus sp. SKADARSKE-3]|nr:Peptidoglycan D,D-transpeptidase MrdA [Syntrophus sp. SKADARSKE-3]
MVEMRGRLGEHDAVDLRRRFKYLFWVVLIALIVVGIRMMYLQIIRGDEFQLRSENNSVRLRKIKPLRGLIMDSRRQVLVDNQPAFDLIYVPNRAGQVGAILEKIERFYAERGLTLVTDIVPTGRVQPFVPIRIEKNISRDKLAVIETHALDLPGVVAEVVPVRKYVSGEMLAQVIGYTGEVSQEELDKNDMDDLSPGDTVGKYGIEKYLDAYLGGKSGAEQVEVNVIGKVVKALGRVEPVAGYNVMLTIDARLQEAAWAAVEGRPGAVVVMDPRDGSILALVSSPSFDPNLFNGGITTKEWEKLSKNLLHPMENRAVSGQYPPGSTYKIVAAAAALEEGLIKEDTKFFCNGAFTLGNRTYRCWQKHGHGWVSLHRALVESCDVYFYNLGKMLGVDRMAVYAQRLGFGSVTGLDLPREKPGLVPTRQWKLARMKEPWQPGETIPIAIGQGFDLVTPLQLVSAYSALANGGTVFRSRLIKQIEAVDGKVVKEFPAEKRSILGFRPETIAQINSGLWGVVNEGGGTGGALRRPEADVAGKTGTAQVIGLPSEDKARKLKIVSARFRDHALFVCFAPFKQPEIAVAVIMENAGHGGSAAAPVARKVIDAYFQNKKDAGKPPAAVKSTQQPLIPQEQEAIEEEEES